MKSDYFALLINDICFSLQSVRSYRIKTEKVMTKSS